jgi:hypothetical protein
METFRYRKLWKASLYIYLGFAIFVLLWLLWIAVIIIWPNIGNPFLSVKFSWWVPFFAIGLIVLIIFMIVGIRKVQNFSIELTEESIRAGKNQMTWGDISLVQFKKSGSGGIPSIILHSKVNSQMEIPGSLEGYGYVSGVIVSHSKNAAMEGGGRPAVEGEKIRFFLSLIQRWKKLGYGYSKRFELLRQAGFGKAMTNYYLGYAECSDVTPEETQEIFTQIQGWKDQGVDDPQRIDRLEKQGFNHVTAKLLVQEADRN